MRILMIEPGGWGGICHYSYNLCKALSHLGCEVVLVTGTPYELAHLPHTFCVEARIPSEASYIQKLRHAIACYRRYCPDILHVQSAFSVRKDWLPAILLKATNKPLVYTAHNILPHDRTEKNALGMAFAHRLLYAFVQHLIVHSEDSRRLLQKKFHHAPAGITVIPHGRRFPASPLDG